MKRILAASALLALTACSTNDPGLTERVAALEKRVSKLEGKTLNKRAEFRQYFDARMQEDRKNYNGKVQEIESAYQAAGKQADPVKKKESLQALISKYPKANRSGCAMLYLGQASEGKEKEAFLLRAIEEYGNCWYGDGVQVGAYARFYLAHYYKNEGKTVEAEKLFAELRKDYPDAIDHRGRLLSESLPNS